MQAAYEDCLNETKNLSQLASIGTIALKNGAAIKDQLEQITKGSTDLHESIDILEMLIQESLRIELGQISADEFRFFVKKLSTKVDLEKIRSQMDFREASLREVLTLLDEMKIEL